MSTQEDRLVSLTLTAVDVVGPTRWRWLLTDEAGAALADHQVDLDRDSAEYAALRDMVAFLQRDDQERTAADLAAWIGRAVFGATIGARLRDVVVIVPVSPETAFLPAYPLEMATVDGRSLAERRVTLVYGLGSAGPKQPVGASLRILALYSMPTRQLPLALRRERYELTRTLQRLASSSRRAIELRILQYGVTRERLRDIVEEAPGWDVLHVSAHGLLGTLLLELPDGGSDEVSTEDMIELLAPTRPSLKLVNLSVCHSGADTAAEVLRRTGLPEADEARQVADAERAATAAHPPTIGLAQGLATELDTVVLAMRYAVADRFAAELSAQLYPQLFANHQPVARAVALALPTALRNAPVAASSAAVPVLFGAAADRLVLAPPKGVITLDPYAERMAWFEPEPRTFVGRTAALASASAALRPDSGRNGVLFLGRHGIGTTSCALELAYRHKDLMEGLAWWRAPRDGDLRDSLKSLADAWQVQLDLPFADALAGEAALVAFLPRLRALLQQRSLLLVLDDVDALLTSAGTWRDPWWSRLFPVLTAHGGDSRVILTGSLAPADLDTGRVQVQPVPPMNMLERVQAFAERDALNRLLPAVAGPARSGTGGGDPTGDGEPLRRLLTLTGGYPALIDVAEEVVAQLPAPPGDATDAIDAEAHLRLLTALERGADRNALIAGLRDALADHGEAL
ncbi:CHAT domain-containing protein [Dactylosporangium sp. NPDC006015]|uniref:CHAT domain-containing protein n=1 Tax=Dactylosporangium sp. NPDC006015 TaxID=3154576 RepID=UPI0033AF6B86